MLKWKIIAANYLLNALVCVFCGALVAFIIVPFYIWLDVIHNWGLMPPSDDALTFTETHFISSKLLLNSFGLAALLTLLRDRALLSLLISVATCPLGFFSPFAIGLTDLKGLWYRGLINGLAFLSLPVLQWLLAFNIILSLPHKKA